ncbi:hypothetical protein [Methanobrevibacter ruminantium]|uniref:hypothetical protein n=1 Tax=Methanobrevibacter ruminantium TaxID=83816 RepID=UPI0026EC5DBD|nr:hypothetical protein [Methanobrevibacter ruminantium]
MDIIKFTILDFDLIKSLPSIVLSELILLEDVIPDGIMSTIYFHNPVFKKERSSFLNHRPDILRKMYFARSNKERLLEKENIFNIETDENVEFINKYPQFKPLIDHIEFCDGDDPELSTIKVVPIDQYLAEN